MITKTSDEQVTRKIKSVNVFYLFTSLAFFRGAEKGLSACLLCMAVPVDVSKNSRYSVSALGAPNTDGAYCLNFPLSYMSKTALLRSMIFWLLDFISQAATGTNTVLT